MLRTAPREAAASLKVTLGKSAILPRFITLLYLSARALITKAQVGFFAILSDRKNTFAIKPSKCKCARGTFVLEQRRSRLYVRGFRPPSRRLGGLRADFAHSKSGFRLFGERIVLNIIKLYPQKDFAIFEGRISMLIVNCVPQKSYSNAPAAPSPLRGVARNCTFEDTCAP